MIGLKRVFLKWKTNSSSSNRATAAASSTTTTTTDRDEEVEAEEVELDFGPSRVLQQQDSRLPAPVVLAVLQQRPA